MTTRTGRRRAFKNPLLMTGITTDADMIKIEREIGVIMIEGFVSRMTGRLVKTKDHQHQQQACKGLKKPARLLTSIANGFDVNHIFLLEW